MREGPKCSGKVARVRITKISVNGLFGMFDHEIPLNQESRITIIHGPNGVGKTVLLRMVHGLFNYEYDFIGKIPFGSLDIECDDGSWITVEKETGDDDDDPTLLVTFEYLDKPGNPRDNIWLRYNTNSDLIGEAITERRPHLQEVYVLYQNMKRYWVSTDSEKPEVWTSEEIVKIYPEIHEEVFGERLPAWFTRIQRSVGPMFIAENRRSPDAMDWEMLLPMYMLSRDSDRVIFPSPSHAAQSCMIDLRHMAEEHLRDSDMESEQLQTRIEQLTQEVAELDEEMAEFNRALVDEKFSSRRHVSPALEDLLADRTDDWKSLKDELRQKTEERDFPLRLELFLEILNERFLFKHVTFDSETGLKITAGDNAEIDETTLSSGEQQFIILYYRLLFETYADMLVLIDEPELSLNVVWQRRFLTDMERIVDLCKFNVLIATHSPQIIHDKWDWMVPLGEKVDD